MDHFLHIMRLAVFTSLRIRTFSTNNKGSLMDNPREGTNWASLVRDLVLLHRGGQGSIIAIRKDLIICSSEWGLFV